MDESVGMLSVAAVLVMGIWLVDYSGDASRARAGLHAAATEAAHYAASAVATPPASVTGAELDAAASAVARPAAVAAALGDCDTADPRFDVTAQVFRAQPGRPPGAVRVRVQCPVRVSPIFDATVSAEVAVEVPTAARARP